MNERSWLWLLLALLLSFLWPQIGMAQGGKNLDWIDSQPPSKQSHRDLPGGLDFDNPQQMIRQRLDGLHDLHHLQDQMQGLLEDQDFLNNVKQRFSEEQLRELRDKMFKGEGLAGDKTWERLLEQATKKRPMSEGQRAMLERLAERGRQPAMTSGQPGFSGQPDAPPPVVSGPNAVNQATAAVTAAPEPSLFDRMQEETTKWLLDHADDVGEDLMAALVDWGAKEDGTPLNELMRAMNDPELFGGNFAQQAAGWSQHLPRMGEFVEEQRGVWDEMRSLFRKTPSPELPNLGTSRTLPASASPTGDAWLPLALSLLMVSAFVLALRKMGLGLSPRSENDDVWRLGPWPVAPEAVSTRQDIVRAFEYLVFLCLGPAAGTRHHRDLAQCLAEQDNGNPARRQAVETLAWLYEQARYAPAGETLSPDEVSDARHALVLLAGVTAA
jgi:hypothetical protein